MTQPPDAYRDAGVDIAAGNRFVEAIKPAAARTVRPGVMQGLGGFGGLFDLAACGYRDPLLVAATDGVGTKLMLAQAVGRYRGLGVDLVAMCANDVAVQGAEPLFFLDYFAIGRLAPEVGREVVEGIADACSAIGCALLGGETAEMPGLYQPGEFDLAGFCVGAVERDRLLPNSKAIGPGDHLIAIASDGLHANGFSLVRKIIADGEYDIQGPAPFAPDVLLGEALVTPTRLYVEPCRILNAECPVKAYAHITGGGLLENVPRVLPGRVDAIVDLASFALPPATAWLAETGQLDRQSLLRTFNCGVGMVAIVSPEHAASALAALRSVGEQAWPLGELRASDADAPMVTLAGGSAWPLA